MTQVGLMDKVHTTVQKENEKKHLNPTNFRVENCDDGSHLDQYTVVSWQDHQVHSVLISLSSSLSVMCWLTQDCLYLAVYAVNDATSRIHLQT
jgi:hypothetical protein